LALAAATVIAGCGAPKEETEQVVAVQAVAPEVKPGGAVLVTVPALRGRPLRPDVLVTGSRAMSPTEVLQVAALAPGAVSFAHGTLRLGSRSIRVASVDPITFRRYAAPGTAESTPVWQVVAGGGIVASHVVARNLRLKLGTDLALTGLQGQGMRLRLGALATTGIPGTDLIVDTGTGRQLGLEGPTAVVLNAGTKDPIALAAKVRRVAGKAAEVDLLSEPASNPMAFLTGGKAAKAFGGFSYKYFPDGTIAPDASWVRNNIVSSRVPILGLVTCHRLMLPQLRGALEDVVTAGLAASINSYDGCYVPRFIERDPAHAISLHTWGIAIDMDASTNYRGIEGTMDPGVVEIFKRWGFRWGGDWTYTDPMHFELAALLKAPR